MSGPDVLETDFASQVLSHSVTLFPAAHTAHDREHLRCQGALQIPESHLRPAELNLTNTSSISDVSQRLPLLADSFLRILFAQPQRADLSWEWEPGDTSLSFPRMPQVWAHRRCTYLVKVLST